MKYQNQNLILLVLTNLESERLAGILMTSGDQPVFLVKGKDSKSIIIILSSDPKAQNIQFKWKKF